MSLSRLTLTSTSRSRTGTVPHWVSTLRSLVNITSVAQVIQGEADSGATPAHLPRRTMRYYRAKSKSLERSELPCSTTRQHPLYSPA